MIPGKASSPSVFSSGAAAEPKKSFAAIAALPAITKRLLVPAVVLVLVALGVFGRQAGAARIWSALLLNDVYLVSLALAAMVFVAIQVLTQAEWWLPLRRVPEAMVSVLPVAAALLLPLFFGRTTLYPWSRPGAVAHDALIAAKSAYLNTPFFFLRLAVVLAIWTVMALRLRRIVRLQESGGEAAESRRRAKNLAALFVPVFAVTWSVASFDWLMSLDPHWYSTIFAVYCFAGLFLGGIAAIALVVVLLRGAGLLGARVDERHLHDLGTLLFGFSTFWAYIWVSQYLLIWYGDIPEEVTFYVARTTGPWSPWFFAAFALEWLIPFLVLLPRAAKRNPKILATVAALVLLGRWIDLYVQIGPPVLGTPQVGVFEVLLAVAYGGLFLGLCWRGFGRRAV